MIQEDFAFRVVETVKEREEVLGVGVGGSWLSGQLDPFSDLDLILITKMSVSDDKIKMLEYAKSFGELMSGFTGEHVGEPRLLICLYKDPLLHVDIKFLTTDEFRHRIEDPALLLDKEGLLASIVEQTNVKFPYPEYQWIEDRFWVWVHYVLLKIGRGELLEALDFFGFLRMTVLGPLISIKNGQLPRGVRKAEIQLPPADLEMLQRTVPVYSKASLFESLDQSVQLYLQLRKALFSPDVLLHAESEQQVMAYFKNLKQTPDK